MVRLWMKDKVIDQYPSKIEVDYEVTCSDPGAKATLEWSKAGPRVVVNVAADGLPTVVIRKVEKR